MHADNCDSSDYSMQFTLIPTSAAGPGGDDQSTWYWWEQASNGDMGIVISSFELTGYGQIMPWCFRMIEQIWTLFHPLHFNALIRFQITNRFLGPTLCLTTGSTSKVPPVGTVPIFVPCNSSDFTQVGQEWWCREGRDRDYSNPHFSGSDSGLSDTTDHYRLTSRWAEHAHDKRKPLCMMRAYLHGHWLYGQVVPFYNWSNNSNLNGHSNFNKNILNWKMFIIMPIYYSCTVSIGR